MNKYNSILVLWLTIFIVQIGYGQSIVNHDKIKNHVITNLSAPTESAYRYHIADISFNSFHWQEGGIIIMEMFENFYRPYYAKYVINVGFGKGANYGSPELSFVNSYGDNANLGKIVLGTAQVLATETQGYKNMKIPIYADIKGAANYTVKITYMQDKVEMLVAPNQIRFYQQVIGVAIPDFNTPNIYDVSLSSSKNLYVTGTGNHIIKNGNVGIGTDTPKEMLSVNGNIRAHQIKVETINWPDYVFNDEYQLPSLVETEKFIKANKHLPEIPKADEVESTGVDLGEMNKILLKKIEELTLYMIDKDKRIQALEETVKGLKK
jgi:hypothetical protein